jgi:MYXO-CTERM domain-containing protein
MKRGILPLLLALMLIFSVIPCFADNPINVGATDWYEFSFGLAPNSAYASTDSLPSSAGNSQYALAPPWTFTSTTATMLTVVDAFTEGDVFTVYDKGSAIGTTSLVPNTGTDSGTDNPAVALTIPDLSKGFFDLEAGDHSITIAVVQNALDTVGGAAFFRVDPSGSFDPAPLPPSVFLLGTGLLGLAGLGWRRRRKNY